MSSRGPKCKRCVDQQPCSARARALAPAPAPRARARARARAHAHAHAHAHAQRMLQASPMPRPCPSRPRPAPREPDFVVVRGAREHNLAIEHLEIPKRQLVVFTGPSGSGKSSLAFDTLYAEGQRRYVETLAPTPRQFLGQLEAAPRSTTCAASPPPSPSNRRAPPRTPAPPSASSAPRSPTTCASSTPRSVSSAAPSAAQEGHLARPCRPVIAREVLAMPRGHAHHAPRSSVPLRKGEFREDLLADLRARAWFRAGARRRQGHAAASRPRRARQEAQALHRPGRRLRAPSAPPSVRAHRRGRRARGHRGARVRLVVERAGDREHHVQPGARVLRHRPSPSLPPRASRSTRRSACAHRAPAWASATRSTPPS